MPIRTTIALALCATALLAPAARAQDGDWVPNPNAPQAPTPTPTPDPDAGYPPDPRPQDVVVADPAMGKVNTSDPKYAAAKARFDNDPFRTVPWRGDTYKSDMFGIATLGPTDNDLMRPKLTYRARKVRLSFTAAGGRPYFDLVGTYRQTVSVQVRRGGRKFKTVGRSQTYVTGTREHLAWFYGMPRRYTTVGMTFAVGRLCRGRTDVRARFDLRFTPNRKQTFQHDGGSQSEVSNNMVGSRTITASAPKRVCR